jgi:hypothetical protein
MSLAMGRAVDIVRVAQVGDLALRLTFSDGRTTVVDFGPFLRRALNPQTRQFADRTRFRSYALRDGNLVWGNYEMCFSIEQLYGGSVGSEWETTNAHPMAVAEDRADYRAKSPARRAKRSGA